MSPRLKQTSAKQSVERPDYTRALGGGIRTASFDRMTLFSRGSLVSFVLSWSAQDATTRVLVMGHGAKANPWAGLLALLQIDMNIILFAMQNTIRDGSLLKRI